MHLYSFSCGRWFFENKIFTNSCGETNEFFYFLSDTAARLSYNKNAALDVYNIPITVRDREGQSATKTLTVNLCACTHPSQCVRTLRTAGVSLGKWAILAILLGIALLFCKSFYLLQVKI